MSEKRTILIAATSDVSTDQRVLKTCYYLVSKNFEVTVFSRELHKSFKVDNRINIIRKKLFFNNGFLFYLEYNFRLFFHILHRNYNFLWSNDLDTLLASYLGSKIRKNDLIYDSHEYFTEVPELQGREFVRLFWLKIEKNILPKLLKTVTVCETIANEYKLKYGVNMEVVRNLPSRTRIETIEEISFPTDKKVILYQGFLNPGRGIKPVIKALKYLPDFDFVIIGFGKVRSELEDFVAVNKMEERVHFLGRISPEKLSNYTRSADVGMVLEEPLGKSFAYSLPNKLFDYIHSELPIIASPLIEVKGIISKYEIGVLVENFEPKHIAEKIQEMIDDKELYQMFKKNESKIKDKFYWENDIKKIDKFFI